MLEAWLTLLLCLAAAWAWQHVLRLRERATRHARELCERHGLQLLDDTVALHRLHARWQRGSVHVTREYRFYTSRGGDHRESAALTVRGGRVVASSLPSIEAAASAVPVASSPFMPASLPRADTSTGNVVPFVRRERRTLH